jgi:uncharacterized protein YcnI
MGSAGDPLFMRNRVLVWIALAAGLAIAVVPATVAAAHVEPDPTEAAAGAAIRLTLTIEHGCNETSPTTEVRVQVPEGASGVAPHDVDGFTGAVRGRAITWTGGSADPHAPAAFAFDVTMPNTPGETALFPTIQVCEQGQVDWIDPPNAGGGGEPENPAPAVQILAASGGSSSSSTATTALSAPTASTTTTLAAAPASDDSGLSGAAIALIVAGVVGGVGIGLAIAMRRRRAG